MKCEISFSYTTAKVSKRGAISGGQGTGTYEITVDSSKEELQTMETDLKAIACEVIKAYREKAYIIDIKITGIKVIANETEPATQVI